MLLSEKPDSWGLRGDPYLWDDLFEESKNVKIPNDRHEVINTFKNIFEEVTEEEYPLKEDVLIEKYKHGGMSQGIISSEFWNKTVIEIILKRFKALN